MVDISNKMASFDLEKIFAAIGLKSNEDYVLSEFKLHMAKITNLE